MSVRRHTLSVWRANGDTRAWALQKGNASMILSAFCSPRPTGSLIRRAFDQSLLDELTARGFDITTLRLTVQGYRHLWIQPGEVLFHRKTREWVRVHHVRWETVRRRGQKPRLTAGVALTRWVADEKADYYDEHVRDVVRRWPYVPLADVERDYGCFDHPRSWLTRDAREAARPWCRTCGAMRSRENGVLVCPRACGRNGLVDALLDRKRKP